MSTASPRQEYLLLFRGSDWSKDLSPEETQQLAGQFMAWFERLSDQGKVRAGQPLHPEGRIVTASKHGTIVDGPFVESKEAIGGYFLLQVDTLEEAVEIARQCPSLGYGTSVEVRPVAEQCPMLARAQELQGSAAR